MQGRLLALLEQFERLPDWINSAPEGIKQYSDYWFAIGAYQLQQADFSTAAESLARAVVRDQTDFRAYKMLGDALTQIGNPSKPRWLSKGLA